MLDYRYLVNLYFGIVVKIIPIVKNPKYIVVTQFPKTTYHYHVDIVRRNVYADIGVWKIHYKDKKLSKHAMSFVKENCLSWCNLEFCHLRACEKPELKERIINGEQFE